MYHPSRGGVRGGRDQFNWDDVKSDKHRENYIGHSVKAPVGRWQKGKDLTWYTNDKKTDALVQSAARDEIKRIKEEEEQAMREILGLAPKRGHRPQGNRLDKYETAELFRRGKTAEELAPAYTEGERVQGLGFAPAPRHGSSKGTVLQTGLFERAHEYSVDPSANNSSGQPLNNESNVSSDVLDSKTSKKLQKREAKEKRKEEKRAAKKASKLEKRKYDGDFSDLDRGRSGKRGRRHDSRDNSN